MKEKNLPALLVTLESCTPSLLQDWESAVAANLAQQVDETQHRLIQLATAGAMYSQSIDAQVKGRSFSSKEKSIVRQVLRFQEKLTPPVDYAFQVSIHQQKIK